MPLGLAAGHSNRERLKRRRIIIVSEGVVKLSRSWIVCPACGQQVEAVASDGRVRGYCAVARRYVNFAVKTQRINENPTANEVVRDYLAGVKTLAIQDKYKISPGRMYRLLHSANVRLRSAGV